MRIIVARLEITGQPGSGIWEKLSATGRSAAAITSFKTGSHKESRNPPLVGLRSGTSKKGPD
jgi:hypothetical protein